jgi:hypothetical protein
MASLQKSLELVFVAGLTSSVSDEVMAYNACIVGTRHNRRWFVEVLGDFLWRSKQATEGN